MNDIEDRLRAALREWTAALPESLPHDVAVTPARHSDQRHRPSRWLALTMAGGLVGAVAVGLVVMNWDRESDLIRVDTPPTQTQPMPTSLPSTVATEPSSTSTTPSTSASPSPQPTPPPVDDLLAGWPAPPTGAPDVVTVPRLLPTVSPVDGVTPTRSESTEAGGGASSYEQTWAAADGTSVLTITTHIDQQPTMPDEVRQPASIDSWDEAFYLASGDGFANLLLEDPSGYVSIWAGGLDEEQLDDIARSMTRRDDGPGWDLGDASAGVESLHEAWASPMAQRQLVWEVDGLIVADMSIVRGGSAIASSIWDQSGSATLTEVRSSPALLVEATTRTAIVWSPEPGVLVRFGLRGSAADLIAAAQSTGVVDAAAWESASTVGPGQSDGCSSMFC